MRRLRSLLILCLLGAVPQTAAAAQEIDAETLLRDLGVLAHDSMGGRLVGSEGGAMARRWIVSRLEGLGLEVDSQSFPILRGDDVLTGVNLAARIPGSDPDAGRAFVVTAHYDHVGVRAGDIYNGADDNASGTAALLAFAEALVERPLRRPALLLFLDAEEGGLRGARHFVEDAGESLLEEFELNLNLDMVSRSEEELWVVGTYQNPSLGPVVEGVEPATGVTLRFGHDSPEWTGSDNWSGASDHAAFDRAGLPFLYFGVEDHPDYHRPGDDPEKVDPVWYRASVETILRVARALDAAGEALAAARAAKPRG
jgi:Zn-dependent M28 family amino/carboxypeptidase